MWSPNHFVPCIQPGLECNSVGSATESSSPTPKLTPKLYSSVVSSTLSSSSVVLTLKSSGPVVPNTPTTVNQQQKNHCPSTSKLQQLHQVIKL